MGDLGRLTLSSDHLHLAPFVRYLHLAPPSGGSRRARLGNGKGSDLVFSLAHSGSSRTVDGYDAEAEALPRCRNGPGCTRARDHIDARLPAGVDRSRAGRSHLTAVAARHSAPLRLLEEGRSWGVRREVLFQEPGFIKSSDRSRDAQSTCWRCATRCTRTRDSLVCDLAEPVQAATDQERHGRQSDPGPQPVEVRPAQHGTEHA